VDADNTKRYSVSVGPGNYAGTFALKPWVWVSALILLALALLFYYGRG